MAFREVVQRLARILRKADLSYCVVGAVAASYHGIPRSTKEIEVLVFPSWVALKESIRELRAAGFKIIDKVGRQPRDFRIQSKEGYRVKFKMANSKWEMDALSRARSHRFFSTAVRLASPEDAALWSLASGGIKGVVDAAGILVRSKGRLDEEYLRQRSEELGIADVFNEVARKVW